MAGARSPARRIGPLASVFVFIVAGPPAMGDDTAVSRDARSAAYCSLRANMGGFYDTEAALDCRREEYTAAARTRGLDIPAELDEYCESLASEGDPIGPFSWRAYVDCLDGVLP